MGLGLTVVQSWTDAIAGGPGWIDQLGDPRGAEWRAKVELDRAVTAIAERHPCSRSTVGRRRAPRDALLRAAGDAAMVVVGARGRGGFARLLLGSVSESVAGRADTTVVVVRGDHDRRGEVLVGVDGSDSSRAALRWAAETARLHQRPLHVVMAWSYLLPEGEHGPEPFRADYTDADARRALSRIVTDELGADPGVEVRQQATCGLAAATILEESDAASLIAVGAHGRSSRLASALGSTTRQSSTTPHARSRWSATRAVRRRRRMMMHQQDTKTNLTVLDRTECLARLADQEVGRLGVIESGHPVVLPINYTLDGDAPVMATAEGVKSRSAHGRPACSRST